MWRTKNVKDLNTLKVFDDLSISFNGSTRHGRAEYSWSEERGCGFWVMNFNQPWKGDIMKMKETVFEQMPGTSSYISWREDPWKSAILIKKDLPPP